MFVIWKKSKEIKIKWFLIFDIIVSFWNNLFNLNVKTFVFGGFESKLIFRFSSEFSINMSFEWNPIVFRLKLNVSQKINDSGVLAIVN